MGAGYVCSLVNMYQGQGSFGGRLQNHLKKMLPKKNLSEKFTEVWDRFDEASGVQDTSAYMF